MSTIISRFTKPERRVDEYIFCLRQSLLGKLYNEVFTPKAECEHCTWHLPLFHIWEMAARGDLESSCAVCPICGRNVYLHVRASGGAGHTFRVYSRKLLLTRLSSCPGLAKYTADQLMREDLDLYYSMVFVLGSVGNAFRLAGLKYEWHDKYLDLASSSWYPFLGRIPDDMIAECTALTPQRVKVVRREKNVTPFSRTKTKKEMRTLNLF